MKDSFLKHIIGRDLYDEYKMYARKVAIFGTVVLATMFALSKMFYSSFLSELLNITTGTSLIFIVYVLSILLALDREVKVNSDEDWNDDYEYSDRKVTYLMTKVWAIILILLAVIAIYYSNSYRKHYAFECETFLVDENCKTYHLEDGHDDGDDIEYTTKMMGYKLEGHGYSICEICKEWAEEQESYEIERLDR